MQCTNAQSLSCRSPKIYPVPLDLLTVRVEDVWVEWIDRVRFRLRSHHRHATRVELEYIGFRRVYFSL